MDIRLFPRFYRRLPPAPLVKVYFDTFSPCSVAGVCFVSGADFGSKLEVASDTCAKGRASGVGAQRALGIFDHDVRIILRGRVELVSLHIIIRDLDGCIVRERTGCIIVPDVLESFQGEFPWGEKRESAVESSDPEEFLVGGGLGINLGDPELCDLVLARDKILDIAGPRVFGVKALEAREGSEVLLSLILALGKVI
jgi:hypothetical protein